MNEFSVIASIVERDILRYTPAGVPIVCGILQHRSEQIEARVSRQIECEINTVAAGEISGQFANVELGAVFQFKGFLAKRNRNSKALTFHVTDLLSVC